MDIWGKEHGFNVAVLSQIGLQRLLDSWATLHKQHGDVLGCLPTLGGISSVCETPEWLENVRLTSL